MPPTEVPPTKLSSTDRTAMAIAWRIAVFYGAIFIVLGVSLPYFPLWLKWQGLSAVEIGLVIAGRDPNDAERTIEVPFLSTGFEFNAPAR